MPTPVQTSVKASTTSPTPTLLETYRTFADPEKILPEKQYEERKMRTQANLLAQRSREKRQAAVASRRRCEEKETELLEKVVTPTGNEYSYQQMYPNQPLTQTYQAQQMQGQGQQAYNTPNQMQSNQTQPYMVPPQGVYTPNQMQGIYPQPQGVYTTNQMQPNQMQSNQVPNQMQPNQIANQMQSNQVYVPNQPHQPQHVPNQTQTEEKIDMDCIPPIMDHFPEAEMKPEPKPEPKKEDKIKKEEEKEDNVQEVEEEAELREELRQRDRKKEQELQDEKSREYWKNRGKYIKDRAISNAGTAVVMATSAVEAFTSAIHFPLIKTKHLADNVEAAIKLHQFDSYIDEMVSIDWIAEMLGSATNGALMLFANIAMETHKENMEALDSGYRSRRKKDHLSPKPSRENSPKHSPANGCHSCQAPKTWDPTAHLGQEREQMFQMWFEKEQLKKEKEAKELEQKMKQTMEEKLKEIERTYKQTMENRLKVLEANMKTEWEEKVKCMQQPLSSSQTSSSSSSVKAAAVGASTVGAVGDPAVRSSVPENIINNEKNKTNATTEQKSKTTEQKSAPSTSPNLPLPNIPASGKVVMDPKTGTPRPTFSSQTTFQPIIAPTQLELANKVLNQLNQEKPSFNEQEPDPLMV